jgi:hypothetical protein
MPKQGLYTFLWIISSWGGRLSWCQLIQPYGLTADHNMLLRQEGEGRAVLQHSDYQITFWLFFVEFAVISSGMVLPITVGWCSLQWITM